VKNPLRLLSVDEEQSQLQEVKDASVELQPERLMQTTAGQLKSSNLEGFS
jgi:hypothetical protein